MNILGIDYGTKRIGLSFSDDEIGFAFPLSAIHVCNESDAISELASIIIDRRVGVVVIGYPVNMDDSVGHQAMRVDEFIEKLLRRVDVDIVRVDERLSSESVEDIRAHRSASSRHRLRARGSIDSAAATIILQDYLNSR